MNKNMKKHTVYLTEYSCCVVEPCSRLILHITALRLSWTLMRGMPKQEQQKKKEPAEIIVRAACFVCWQPWVYLSCLCRGH